jgi:hypothetical protein
MAEIVKLREMERNDRRRLVMPEDVKLYNACVTLRSFVEHPNDRSEEILVGGVYRPKNPEAWSAINLDGVQVGYRVVPCSPLLLNPYFDRWAFFSVPGYRINELSVKQLVSIKTAILHAFFEPQMGKVWEDVKGHAEKVILAQRFMVAMWAPKQPGIVKTLTGVDTDAKGVIVQ